MHATTSAPRLAPAFAGLLAVLIPISAFLAIADLTGWIDVPKGGALKPLTVLLIALHVACQPSQQADRRRWVLAGLGTSIIGDCLLAMPSTQVHAVCALSLAQVCYLRAMVGKTLALARPGLLHLLHAIPVAWALSLWSVGPASFFVPVVIFMVLLGLVAAQADTWWWRARGTAEAAAACRAAIGGLLWIVADLLWTFSLFVAPIPDALAIAVTLYLLAQWSFASMIGVREADARVVVPPACAPAHHT